MGKTAGTIVIGGGVIGLATALELQTRGQSVTLLEAKTCGAGCSTKALGTLLTPLPTRDGELSQSIRQSLNMYGDFIQTLEELSGIHTGHAIKGHIHVPVGEAQIQA